jgi:signal transduction histidine kinase
MTADPTTIVPLLPGRLPNRVPLTLAGATEPAERGRPVDEERFAAYLAHELRTPLATQRALLELTLADPLSNRASWREVARDVLDACHQQERLLEACLTLARSRGGLLHRDRIDLSTIAYEALRTHDRSGVACLSELEPAVLRGDPVLVERLVANLVSNAIRYNLAGGRMEVATRTTGGRAVLVVANTGPIIPAMEIRRLFQPFYRLDTHRPGAGDGIGLGLPIVQAIADAHDASVTAEALSAGGLRLEVRFPAVPSL